MVVIPGFDVYTALKPQINGKIFRKTQKDDTALKTY